MNCAKSFRISSELFQRGLAIVYAIAFASLYTQALGLYGHQGILPITKFLSQIYTNIEAMLIFLCLVFFGAMLQIYFCRAFLL